MPLAAAPPPPLFGCAVLRWAPHPMADYAVGAQVEVELSLPGGSETASGTVFAYDAASDRLVLRQPGSTPFHSTLRLLKGADVARVTQLKAAPPGGATPLPAVDLGRCREREEKAVRAAEAEAAKIGVGVGRTAQVGTGWGVSGGVEPVHLGGGPAGESCRGRQQLHPLLPQAQPATAAAQPLLIRAAPAHTPASHRPARPSSTPLPRRCPAAGTATG